MPKFRVTYDQKATVWIRSTADIEADSLEEAQAQLKAMTEQGDMVHPEILQDTIEFMTRKENYVALICDQLLDYPEWNEHCSVEVNEFEEHLNYEL